MAGERPEATPPPRDTLVDIALPADLAPAGAALVVDDEQTIRGLAGVALRALGFRVTEAATGREAVDLLQADPGRYALALLDMTMPGMDGRETLAALRTVRPDLPVVVMSGYSESDLTDLPVGPTLHFLQKPFRPADLTGCVRRVVGGTAVGV